MQVGKYSLDPSLFAPAITPLGGTGETSRQILLLEKDGGGTRILHRRDAHQMAPLAQVQKVFAEVIEELDRTPFSSTVSFANKVDFFGHLVEVQHLIEKHNDRLDKNFWVNLLQVILCIFTLGLFNFKERIKLPTLPLNLFQIIGGTKFSREERKILYEKLGSDLGKYGYIVPPYDLTFAALNQFAGNARFRCTRTCAEFLAEKIAAKSEALTSFLGRVGQEKEVENLEDTADVIGAFAQKLQKQDSPQQNEFYPHTIVALPEGGEWNVQSTVDYLVKNGISALVTGETSTLTLAIRIGKDGSMELFDPHGFPKLPEQGAYVAHFDLSKHLADFLKTRMDSDYNAGIHFWPLKIEGAS